MTTSYAILATGFTVALLACALGVLLGSALERKKQQAQKAEADAAILRSGLRGEPLRFDGSVPMVGTAGWTIAAAMNGVGPLGRSAHHEPVFVLVARDKAASMIVREWADLAERLGSPRDKVEDARSVAARMADWRERHGGGKVPD